MTNSRESGLVQRPFPNRHRLFLVLLVALALLLTEHSASAESRIAWKRALWGHIVWKLISPFLPASPSLWRDVPAEERARVLGALKARPATEYGAILDQLSDLRAQELPFYPDAVLYEGRVEGAPASRNRFAFVRHPQGYTVLTGEAEPIYALNASAPLHLDTEPQAKAYLRFFCAALETNEGDTFTVVEQPDELPWKDWSTPDRPDVERPLRNYNSPFPVDQETRQRLEREVKQAMKHKLGQDVAQKLKPLALQRGDGDLWLAEGTILYRNMLYDIKFEIAPDGQATMLSDQQQSAELPVQSPRFAEAVRRARQSDHSQSSGFDHHERTRL